MRSVPQTTIDIHVTTLLGLVAYSYLSEEPSSPGVSKDCLSEREQIMLTVALTLEGETRLGMLLLERKRISYPDSETNQCSVSDIYSGYLRYRLPTLNGLSSKLCVSRTDTARVERRRDNIVNRDVEVRHVSGEPSMPGFVDQFFRP